MNVLLIRPNVAKDIVANPHKGDMLYSLLSIASYVNQPDKLRIAIHPDDSDYIEQCMPWADAIGFSAVTYEYEPARALARQLKQAYPDKLYFIGGVHATLLDRYDTEVFDFMAAGEGERVIRQLVNDEITLRPSNEYHKLTPDRILKPEEIPIVHYSHYPFLSQFTGRKDSRLALLSARGCPFRNCRFCSSVRFDPVFRMMPVENLMQQIRTMFDETGVESYNIWDDSFGNFLSYTKKLRELLYAEDIRLRDCTCFIRTANRQFSDEEYQTLQDIGIHVLLPGVESGSERLIKYMKGIQARVENNKNNFLRAKDHGFKLLGSVILGNPTETEEDMKDTLKFMEWFYEQDIDGIIWVYVATPWPGSGYWDIAFERGKVTHDMDFSRIGYKSVENPLLLDEQVPKKVFQSYFERAQELSGEIQRKNFGDQAL